MKTFKDLKFKTHKLGAPAVHAEIKFNNGHSISVISGHDGFYCSEGTYEMMSSATRSSDGIRGYLTPKQITAHMRYIQTKAKSK